MRKKKSVAARVTNTALCVAALLILAPVDVSANVGIPMLAVEWPLMVLALIPVIIVEALYGRAALDISFFESIKIFGIANVVSTIIGVPVAWFGHLVLQGSTADYARLWKPSRENPVRSLIVLGLQSAWLPPDFEGSNSPYKDLGWIWDCAPLFMFIPMFLASWVIESLVVCSYVETATTGRTCWVVFVANLLSYLMLGLVCGFLAAVGGRKDRERDRTWIGVEQRASYREKRAVKQGGELRPQPMGSPVHAAIVEGHEGHACE